MEILWGDAQRACKLTAEICRERGIACKKCGGSMWLRPLEVPRLRRAPSLDEAPQRVEIVCTNCRETHRTPPGFEKELKKRLESEAQKA